MAAPGSRAGSLDRFAVWLLHTSSQAHDGRDIVVVGASAGGLETLKRLLTGVPDDLPAAIPTAVASSKTPEHKTRIEAELVMERHDVEDMHSLGTPSSFSCPSCGGS